MLPRRRYVMVLIGLLAVASTASAQLPGAIFTTNANDTEVNFNQYASKEDVYLNGGPGVNAPVGAAGLPDGTYVFQVTNPNGKVLLSTDPAGCRQFTVSGGFITAVVPFDTCQHVTGPDSVTGGVTVQLFPFLDTPNHGGVYKAWVTPLSDFQAGCSALGHGSDFLTIVDCGFNAGNAHGFIPSNSKTDNFKVKEVPIIEIDTRFYYDRNGNGRPDSDEAWVDGLGITWIDTLGASNAKWSYFNTAINVNHEAHVEGVENGVHRIVVPNQPGCTVGLVRMANVPQEVGPQTVDVHINNLNKPLTVFVDVACIP